jgi:hypothetical protein
MVSANPAKELPNVLPKCNPFPPHIEYYIYGAVGACQRQARASLPRTLTSRKRLWLMAKTAFCSKRCSSEAHLCCCKNSRLLGYSPSWGGFIHLAKGFILWQIALRTLTSISPIVANVTKMSLSQQQQQHQQQHLEPPHFFIATAATTFNNQP